MPEAKATCPAHAPSDHPKVPRGKTGVLLANLGTPDGYDYWPMRRYLNEFLSDKRVIDYPKWKWQPILQLIILTKRPFSSGKAYESIWDKERGGSPLMLITEDQTAAISDAMQERYGDYVLMRPPLQANTLLLWGMPLIFVLAGGLLAFRYIRSQAVEDETLSDADLKKAEALMKEDGLE